MTYENQNNIRNYFQGQGRRGKKTNKNRTSLKAIISLKLTKHLLRENVTIVTEKNIRK